MQQMPRLTLLLASCALAACSFDEQPPSTSGPAPTITCTADDQCPSGWLCPRSLGRCVLIAKRDDVAPSLVGAPTLTPALGAVSSLFTLAFTVSESLGEDPVLTVGLGGGREATWAVVEAQTDRAALRYTYRYVAAGNEEEGTRLLAVDLVDAAGNAVDNLSAGSLVLDFTRPRVVAAVLTPRLAAAGTPVQLELQVSEPLPSAPVLELVHPDGTTRGLTAAGEVGALGYRYTYTPTGQEPEGDATVRATGGDAAGNLLEAPEVATLRLDFSPPTLLRTLVAPAVARAGQRVLAEVDLAEELAAGGTLVAVDLSAGATGTHTWPEVSRGSTRLRFEHTVAVNTDGRYRLELRDVTDLAGNRASTLVVGEVQYDTTAPGVARVASDAPRYSAQTGHDVVTVTFDLDDPLTDGTLEVRLGSTVMTCSAWQPTAPSVTCTATLTGSETEGVTAVSVRALDAAGNEGFGSALVRLDFTPPRLVPGTVELTLQARPGCPAPAVTRLGVGATARVSFVLDEAAGALPVVATSTPGVLTFQHLGGAATSFSFTHTLGSAPVAQGTYALEATVVDEVGNAATLPLSAPLVVDTASPTLQVDQAAVRYVRSPWGSSAPEDLGGFTLRAGPLFELAPAEPLSGQATFPASTFSVDDGALLRLQVWADGQRGSLIGNAAANPDGTWPRLQLANLDTPAAWVSAYDEGCNESVAVRLEQAEWVATPRPASFGVSMHAAWTTRRANDTLTQSVLLSQTVEGDSLAAPDQASISVEGAPVWEQEPAPAPASPSNTGGAMAFDSARGRTVYFGRGTSRDTWEWDGRRWVEMVPTGEVPPARSTHTMAYDSARGRVVLFSGGAVADTWVWDGTTWKDVTPASGNPPTRQYGAMAYDSARQRVVLYGGITGSFYVGETWEWDGERWTRRATSGPPVRWRASMAYDSTRGRVVLFGGYRSSALQDTWEWDGSTWRLVPPATTAPPPTYGHQLAFDSVRERVLLFGGNAGGVSSEKLWEWDGADWRDVTPAGGSMTPRYDPMMSFDTLRGRLVNFAGAGSGTSPPRDTQEWDGQRWNDVTPSPQAPTHLTNHAMAWDSGRGRLVMFGGAPWPYKQETWEFSAGNWRLITPLTSAPPGRTNLAMAYDPVRRRVVLFGGYDGNSRNDTWEWDGRDWYDVTPDTGNPSGRYYHALAWDPLRERVILYGGYPGLGDTWEWDGVAWRNVTPASSPPARYAHALSTDLHRQRIVLFGGRTTTPAGEQQDTWEWDGKVWTQLTPATPSPAPRNRHALAYDPVKQRVVLFGGGASSGSTYRDDTWEWDGVRWSQMAPQPAAKQPPGRYDYPLSWDGERVLLFGGHDQVRQGHVWRYESTPARPPAVGFSARSATSGISASQIDGLRVRAHCGAAVDSSIGAQLQAWFTGGLDHPPGSWGVLATNTSGIATTTPWLPAPPAASLEWTASSPSEARALLYQGDSTFNVRCMPLAQPGLVPGRVAMDYAEVRVRYRTQ